VREKNKILIVSMPSIHVVRWIENIPDDYEVHWFDVLDRGALDTSEKVIQHLNWKQRSFHKFKGAFTLRKYFPFLYRIGVACYDTSLTKSFLKLVEEVKPDIVHSFNLQAGGFPILKVMKIKKDIPWIINCWGNDIYYFQKFQKEQKKIRATLSRVNYFTADCYRDYKLASNMGFRDVELPMIPGGGGYHLNEMFPYRSPISKRKIILIKGYHHIFGRAISVLQALETIEDKILPFDVVIFGAHPPVLDFVKNKGKSWKVYGRHDLSHTELIKLMGQSLIYIGNNISDGMPNTLLEAIIMGAFPIQSNPGGATAEIIENEENGYLIENPEDFSQISDLLSRAINSKELLEKAFSINENIAIERLEYQVIKNQIQEMYSTIFPNIKN